MTEELLQAVMKFPGSESTEARKDENTEANKETEKNITVDRDGELNREEDFVIVVLDRGENVKLSIGQMIGKDDDVLTVKHLECVREDLFAWSIPSVVNVFEHSEVICTLPSDVFLKTKKSGCLQTRYSMERYIVMATEMVKEQFGKDVVIV